jgi:pimeloyl-ACP methyl ester carboxylesterase
MWSIPATLLALTIAYPNPLRAFLRYPPPSRYGLEYESVPLADGSVGWLFSNRSASGTVVVVHGRSRSKAYMLPLVAILAPGYNVFAVDLPGHGENPFQTTTLGWEEGSVLDAALSFLESQGEERIVLFGTSTGGATILIHQGMRPHRSVVGIVTDGAFWSLTSMLEGNARKYRLPEAIHQKTLSKVEQRAGYTISDVEPALYARRIEVPVLAVHGDRDPLISPESASKISGAAPRGRHILYSGKHDRPENPEMHSLVLSFLQELGL